MNDPSARAGAVDPLRSHPFWRDVFGNAAPVEVEIGPGDGTFLVGAAAQHPHTNFLGIERSRAKARRLDARLAASGIERVRVIHADAACVITALIPADSVAAYHVYFPDPWPKRRHVARRLFTTALVDRLAETLVPGGQLFLATDVYGYMRLIHTRVAAANRFSPLVLGATHPGFATGFARKYCARGRSIYTAAYARSDPRQDQRALSVA